MLCNIEMKSKHALAGKSTNDYLKKKEQEK
jgi:hypothetical protein